MSELAERCVKTVGEQYDPAQACETAANVVSVVEDDMDRARAESDFDRLQALAELRSVLEPFAGTCEPTKKPEKDGKSDSISLVKRES